MSLFESRTELTVPPLGKVSKKVVVDPLAPLRMPSEPSAESVVPGARR